MVEVKSHVGGRDPKEGGAGPKFSLSERKGIWLGTTAHSLNDGKGRKQEGSGSAVRGKRRGGARRRSCHGGEKRRLGPTRWRPRNGGTEARAELSHRKGRDTIVPRLNMAPGGGSRVRTAVQGRTGETSPLDRKKKASSKSLGRRGSRTKRGKTPPKGQRGSELAMRDERSKTTNRVERDQVNARTLTITSTCGPATRRKPMKHAAARGATTCLVSKMGRTTPRNIAKKTSSTTACPQQFQGERDWRGKEGGNS